MAELTKQVFADVEASKYQVGGSIRIYHKIIVCVKGEGGEGHRNVSFYVWVEEYFEAKDSS